MQRQSLGSPSSSKVVKDEKVCCEPQKQSYMSISTEEEEEAVKKLKARSGGAMPESCIHLIPMLTLLCFLILYLSSHDPSLNDLPQFHAFAEVGDIIKKGDILAMRSLKNLKLEPDAAKYRRLHRKFAHF